MAWMLLIVVAGVLTGSFGLPLKFTTRWKWEHTWAVFSVWALLVMPWIVGLATVPHLFTVLRESGAAAVLVVFGLGCLWGISSVSFGLGLHYLGLGLGYSLMMGLIISVGSLLPLFGAGADVSGASTLAVLGGIAVILLGVALSGWAAVIREKDQTASAAAAMGQHRRLLNGLLVCVVAGVTAPMLNMAFVQGETIRATAVRLGASHTLAPNAVWAITLLGGGAVNLVCTLWLVHTRGAWHRFVEPGTAFYYFHTFLMALLWTGSIVVYGMAVANLGELGVAAGWGAFNATGIVWANCLGLLTREWKGVHSKGMATMAAGLTVLLIGVLLMGLAKAL